MNNKGQCCEATVASAVQRPQSQRVLSRLIAERAFLWIIMIVQERITVGSRREAASSEAATMNAHLVGENPASIVPFFYEFNEI